MSTPALSDKNSPYFQAAVPGITQVIAFTNSAQFTSNFAAGTTLIEVFATQDCWVRVVESTDNTDAVPISSGGSGLSTFCPGGIVRFIGLPFKKDVLYKLSIVRDSTNGTAYINEAL